MARCILVAAMALCGCAPSSDTATAPRSRATIAAAALPFDDSTGFLTGYLLKVPRHGDCLWNGTPVSPVILKEYLRQYARLPDTAGDLSVAFEPGVAQTRAARVRRQVLDSGLCERRRCAEVAWNVKRPIVN